MIRVVGYVGRERIVVDEGPASAIVHQPYYGTRAVIGGTLVVGDRSALDAKLEAQRIGMRRLRAARREIARLGL